ALHQAFGDTPPETSRSARHQRNLTLEIEKVCISLAAVGVRILHWLDLPVVPIRFLLLGFVLRGSVSTSSKRIGPSGPGSITSRRPYCGCSGSLRAAMPVADSLSRQRSIPVTKNVVV